MSNLVQKEKELLKMNAELDRRTKTVLDPVKVASCNNSTGTYRVNVISRNRKDKVTDNSLPVPASLGLASGAIDTATFTKRTSTSRSQDNSSIMVDDCEGIEPEMSVVGGASGWDAMTVLDSSSTGPVDVISGDEGISQLKVMAAATKLGNQPKTNPAKGIYRSNGCGDRTFTRPSPGLSNGGLISLLKSKIGILEGELEIASKELAKKIQQIENMNDNRKKLEAHRDQALQKNNCLMEELKRFQDKLLLMEAKLKDNELEHVTSVQELDESKRQLKKMMNLNRNLEKRLQKANENVQRLEERIKEMQNAERESRECCRKDREAYERQVSMSKRQRSELLNAYKKQLFIIDNLRRQNACHEQARMINFGEKEFAKVLDWNCEN